MGIALLERFGEDWQTLRQSGADDSLRNLRLLHVHSNDTTDEAWRLREEDNFSIVRAASHLGESDLPSLALDFVVLRCLGLIRYRDGTYQIALPTDAGVVELKTSSKKGMSAESEEADPKVDLFRRRFFTWLSLSPDPIIAAERVYRLAERSSELDLFITPLLTRIRQGHSPDILLHSVARCQTLLEEGRDPSPWSWIRKLIEKVSISPSIEIPVPHTEIPSESDKSEYETTVKDPLEGFAEAPLPGWATWWRDLTSGGSGRSELAIRIPRVFFPRAEDLVVGLDLPDLLRTDWETTGWATGAEVVELPFRIVDASPFRLGLFDHFEGSDSSKYEVDLGKKLQCLAELSYQGLLRLWIDLRQDRVEETSASMLTIRRRENVDEALIQSLEILREMVVKRIAPRNASAKRTCSRPSVDRQPVSTRRKPSLTHDRRPSQFLRGLIVQRPRLGNVVEQQLADRFVALGLESSMEADQNTSYLCTSVGISSEQVDRVDAHAGDGLGRPDAVRSETEEEFTDLRRHLNRMVRELFELSFLARYRNRPIRRPPRLTIFMVGDMAEPFVRSAFRTVLREIHAELLRSFAPIFEYFREGFDRSLSIVPIIWMPHPADPFEGGGVPARQREEAAIINAIQSTRRWVESVIPIARRRVSQIFINSRVTDTSVLSTADAVRQTRDFIAFQTRNAIHEDEWLRRTAVGPFGDDFFSSFSCYEIEFPAEKACEYLSNRLAQDLLEKVLEGRRRPETESEVEGFAPPSQQVKKALPQARRKLADQTRQAADEVAGRVKTRATVDLCSKSGELCHLFDDRFGSQLEREIQLTWERLARGHGEMDQMIDRVRRETSQVLASTLEEARKSSDGVVEGLVGDLGIRAAVARLHALRDAQQTLLRRFEEERRRQEAQCLRHGVPRPERVQQARLEVARAAEQKPECRPMIVHGLLWLVLAPVLGGPLCQTLAYAFELHQRPTWLEPVLGTHGLWTGGLLAIVAAGLFLRQKLRIGVRRVENAIQHLAATARRLIHGADDHPEDGPPSIHSFFATRLLLTDALASRSFTLQVFESSETDFRLADRMGRSVETQCQTLRRQAENLGVRPAMGGDRRKENLDYLFRTRSGLEVETLVKPRILGKYYEDRFGADNEILGVLPQFLREAGGFQGWRSTAILADTERLLGYTRQNFNDLLERTLAELPTFADEASAELVRFVAHRYANIGFGAKFVGSEGLDPDGVNLIAEAALVLCPELKRLFEKGRQRADVPPTTRTMEILEHAVRGNAAYMLSLAQGIRPHTIRNLKRFESFHDRTFSLMGYEQPDSVNHFTAYPELSRPLSYRRGETLGPSLEDEDRET